VVVVLVVYVLVVVLVVYVLEEVHTVHTFGDVALVELDHEYQTFAAVPS
jgi:hypothetical protein